MSDSVRSVKRALGLIRLMNTRPVWALADLTLATGHPKTSVFRLLKTLEEEGFVRSMTGSRGLYSLSSSVQDLASGVTSGSVLGEICAPAVISGTKRLRWPLSVAILDDCYMRVVFCGMPYSRLAAKTTTLNKRYWMFTSALGKTYFSFAHVVEQQAIVERAATLMNDHGMLWPYSQTQLTQQIKEVRKAGYGIRLAEGKEATSAIAIPIDADGEIFGALVCSTYPRSLTGGRIRDLLPAMSDVRSEILAQWQQVSPKLLAHAGLPPNRVGEKSLKPVPKMQPIPTRGTSIKVHCK